mgnify:CR=1 FL=1
MKFGKVKLAKALKSGVPVKVTGHAGGLPAGYLTEVHPVAGGFMASLARMLAAGKGAALNRITVETSNSVEKVPYPNLSQPAAATVAAAHHGSQRRVMAPTPMAMCRDFRRSSLGS